jgi:hypothetical protein
MVSHNTFPPQRRKQSDKKGVLCARAGAKGVKVFGSANSVGLPFIQKNVSKSTTLNNHFRTPVLVSSDFQYYTRKFQKKSLFVDLLLFFRCYYAPYGNTRGFKSDYIVSCVGI